MELREKLAHFFANNEGRGVIVSQSALLLNENYEMRGRAHYELARLYRKEAKRVWILAILYKSFYDYHVNEGVINSRIFPGSLGMRAIDEIEDGKLIDGLRDMQEEINRLARWIELPSVVDESDRVQLFLLLKNCGDVSAQLGQFPESRKWLKLSLEQFRTLDATSSVELGESAEKALLGIVLSLQLEMKYQEALDFVDSVVGGFQFSAYTSQTEVSFRALRDILTEFLPYVSEFKEEIPADEVMRELIGKVQECESAEAIRSVKREIDNTLKATNQDVGVEKASSVAISIVQRQIDLMQKVLQSTQRSQKSMASQRGIFADVTNATAQLLEGVTRFSIATSKESLAKLLQMAKTVEGTRLSYRLKWAWYMTFRVLLQIVAVSFIVEKVIEPWFDKRSEGYIKQLELERYELINAAIIALTFLVIGKFVEKWIDKKFLAKNKVLLTLIVVDRLQTLWSAYNGIMYYSLISRGEFEKFEAAANQLLEAEDDDDTEPAEA
jgi:hypothetical protein